VLRRGGITGGIVVGCFLSLGCASSEKPPLVIVAAPPAPSAPPTPSSTVVVPATSTTTSDSERLDPQRARSTPTPATGDPLAGGAPTSAASEADLKEEFDLESLDRELRGLDLLQKAGEGRCSGSPDTEQHSECVLAEMERMVTELAPACAKKSGQAQHQCIVDEIFRQLGP
jgi:hypothetical protein